MKSKLLISSLILLLLILPVINVVGQPPPPPPQDIPVDGGLLFLLLAGLGIAIKQMFFGKKKNK